MINYIFEGSKVTEQRQRKIVSRFSLDYITKVYDFLQNNSEETKYARSLLLR